MPLNTAFSQFVSIANEVKSIMGDETVHMRSRSFRVFFDCGTVEIFSLDDGGYYSAATAECGTVGTLEVRSDAAISLSVWPLG